MKRRGLSSHTFGLTARHRYRSGSARSTILTTQGELGSGPLIWRCPFDALPSVL
jgi:hypothetical protein